MLHVINRGQWAVLWGFSDMLMLLPVLALAEERGKYLLGFQWLTFVFEVGYAKNVWKVSAEVQS